MELPEETLKKADSMTYTRITLEELLLYVDLTLWRRRDLSGGGRGIVSRRGFLPEVDQKWSFCAWSGPGEWTLVKSRVTLTLTLIRLVEEFGRAGCVWRPKPCDTRT